jgi:hypothetical protein
LILKATIFYSQPNSTDDRKMNLRVDVRGNTAFAREMVSIVLLSLAEATTHTASTATAAKAVWTNVATSNWSSILTQHHDAAQHTNVLVVLENASSVNEGGLTVAAINFEDGSSAWRRTFAAPTSLSSFGTAVGSKSFVVSTSCDDDGLVLEAVGLVDGATAWRTECLSTKSFAKDRLLAYSADDATVLVRTSPVVSGVRLAGYKYDETAERTLVYSFLGDAYTNSSCVHTQLMCNIDSGPATFAGKSWNLHIEVNGVAHIEPNEYLSLTLKDGSNTCSPISGVYSGQGPYASPPTCTPLMTPFGLPSPSHPAGLLLCKRLINIGSGDVETQIVDPNCETQNSSIHYRTLRSDSGDNSGAAHDYALQGATYAFLTRTIVIPVFIGFGACSSGVAGTYLIPPDSPACGVQIVSMLNATAPGWSPATPPRYCTQQGTYGSGSSFCSTANGTRVTSSGVVPFAIHGESSVVILGTAENVTAYDASHGTILYSLQNTLHSSLILAVTSNGGEASLLEMLSIERDDKSVHVIDARSGAPIWHSSSTDDSQFLFTPAAIDARGFIYINNGIATRYHVLNS